MNECFLHLKSWCFIAHDVDVICINFSYSNQSEILTVTFTLHHRYYHKSDGSSLWCLANYITWLSTDVGSGGAIVNLWFNHLCVIITEFKTLAHFLWGLHRSKKRISNLCGYFLLVIGIEQSCYKCQQTLNWTQRSHPPYHQLWLQQLSLLFSIHPQSLGVHRGAAKACQVS